jgi:acyl carrier protein phosphodiesterase
MRRHRPPQADAMNYLAHLYLAGRDPEAQLGGLLGDFAKPRDDHLFPARVRREIRLHRAIDAYTDVHPLVLGSKALFRPGARRFSGMVLDVLYDHFLADGWARHSDEDLDAFIARFYAHLGATPLPLPGRLARVAPLLIAQDWLGSYRSLAGVERAVDGMSRRVSRHGDQMRAGLDDVREHYDALRERYDGFFPALSRFVEDERRRLPDDGD